MKLFFLWLVFSVTGGWTTPTVGAEIADVHFVYGADGKLYAIRQMINSALESSEERYHLVDVFDAEGLQYLWRGKPWGFRLGTVEPQELRDSTRRQVSTLITGAVGARGDYLFAGGQAWNNYWLTTTRWGRPHRNRSHIIRPDMGSESPATIEMGAVSIDKQKRLWVAHQAYAGTRVAEGNRPSHILVSRYYNTQKLDTTLGSGGTLSIRVPSNWLTAKVDRINQMSGGEVFLTGHYTAEGDRKGRHHGGFFIPISNMVGGLPPILTVPFDVDYLGKGAVIGDVILDRGGEGFAALFSHFVPLNNDQGEAGGTTIVGIYRARFSVGNTQMGSLNVTDVEYSSQRVGIVDHPRYPRPRLYLFSRKSDRYSVALYKGDLNGFDLLRFRGVQPREDSTRSLLSALSKRPPKTFVGTRLGWCG